MDYLEYKNFLAHYGVLGMKWGIRRSREVRSAKSAHEARIGKLHDDLDRRSSKSFGGKKSLRIGSPEYKKMRASESKNEGRFESDIKKENTRYQKELSTAKTTAANRLYSKNGKETNNRIANMSTSKALAESLFMGSYGAYKFNQARAGGQSKAQSVLAGVMLNVGNQLLGYWPGFFEGHANRKARKGK